LIVDRLTAEEHRYAEILAVEEEAICETAP
jgi:hypothetical protein